MREYLVDSMKAFRDGVRECDGVAICSTLYLNRQEHPEMLEEFARGNIAMWMTGPWNLGEFRRRLSPTEQNLWMTAPLPGPNGPGASTAGGSSLVVFEASRAKDAAWQLIEFLSAPEIQREFHALTGDLPPRTTVP